MSKVRKNLILIYLALLPSIGFVLTFGYFPPLHGIYLSFTGATTYASKMEFRGFNNYIRLLKDPVFHRALKNLLCIESFRTIMYTIIPLIVAYFIYSIKNYRLKGTYRLIILVQMVAPSIVILLLWKFIYDPYLGPLNDLLKILGLGRMQRIWLGDPKIAIYSIMFVGFPFVTGFGTMFYLAGLENIPLEVIEAAIVDGASKTKILLNVQLPLILGQLKVVLFLSIINGIQSYQDILILTGGGPGYSTMVPGLYMYRNAFQYEELAYSASISVFLFLIILILSYVNLKYVKSEQT